MLGYRFPIPFRADSVNIPDIVRNVILFPNERTRRQNRLHFVSKVLNYRSSTVQRSLFNLSNLRPGTGEVNSIHLAGARLFDNLDDEEGDGGPGERKNLMKKHEGTCFQLRLTSRCNRHAERTKLRFNHLVLHSSSAPFSLTSRKFQLLWRRWRSIRQVCAR